uniref:acid phosphatase n=1 Tax=Biomphalaria glabrata TaxID=6526 RepID=A0A2C9KJX8_BIOGL
MDLLRHCWYFVLGLFLCSAYAWMSPPETLKLVSVLYRHGDRSPTTVYPLDKNKPEIAWPDGLGWLTTLGMQQQYQLGQYLKKRYDGFLNTSYYNHNEILIQSSGIERCLMSAYSNLAGLFPPHGEQIWKNDLLWQPIPVHTTNDSTDNKLALGAPCPRYDQLNQQVLNSPAMKKEEQDNKDFYEMVEKNTGILKETIKDIWAVGDTLFCEKAHNLTWNDWANQPGVWDKMDKLRTLSFNLLTYTPEMARLKGGPLLKEIISNMQAATQQDNPSPKFYMYSAHDTTVAALLSVMNVFDCHAPMYRALIMVELHYIQNDYYVKISYRNDTSREPYELIPTGCQNPCRLVDFIHITKDFIPDDWDAECKIQQGVFPFDTSLSPASWIALAVGICLSLVIIVGLIALLVKLKRKHIYSQL